MSSRFRRLRNLLLIALLQIIFWAGVYFRAVGVSRSFWLDEAWVANSVLEPSIRAMFFYGAWLQTTPPLFLLFTRAAVSVIGLSYLSLRLIPLLSGIGAIVVMYFLARRVAWKPFAIAAWAVFCLSRTPIRLSAELKAYSSELLASTLILLVCVLYVKSPSRRLQYCLAGLLAAGVSVGFGTVFLIVPVLLVVALATYRRHRRVVKSIRVALGLGCPVFILLLAQAKWLIQPNTSPTLRQFWFDNAADRLSLPQQAFLLVEGMPFPDRLLAHHELIGGIVLFVLLTGLVSAAIRAWRVRPEWACLQLLFGLPILALFAAHNLKLYPASARTVLFLAPCFILLVTRALQQTFVWAVVASTHSFARRSLQTALTAFTLGVLAVSISQNPPSELGRSVENFQAAFSFLESHRGQSDALYVHSSCSESYKLYSRMTPRSMPAAVFGHTGWPCCPRGVEPFRVGMDTMDRDLGQLLQPGPARVWVLYTTRSGHTSRLLVDETAIRRDALGRRGCPEVSVSSFENVAVALYDCGRAEAAQCYGRRGVGSLR
jgi:4-amino-4-deoxy-L-arabinose transferase-like glycosyltransferase